MTNRRDLLLIGLGLAGVAAGWQMWVARPQPLAFEPIANLPGWRIANAGQVSAPSSATFLTIGQDTETARPLSHSALEDVLYRTRGTPPMAVFSDFFCPFCRPLTARLARRPDLAITWHELPLLGAPSEIAARASVAADFQGSYASFVAALAQRGFRPSPAHMGRVAEDLGLDAERLVRDMAGNAVAERLAMSRRAAATLGIYGTPGMTVGRTLVMGEIEMVDLDRLITLETR